MENEQISARGVQEISIGEMIREIFRHFWMVIVVAVICAVVSGGYQYVQDIQAAAVASEEEAAKNDVSDIELTDEEQTAVNNAYYTQMNLDHQQQYVDNSVLMQIDAYNEDIVVLQYAITMESDEELQAYGSNLLSLYQSYVDDGSLATAIAEDGYEVSLPYLTELISRPSEITIERSSATSSSTQATEYVSASTSVAASTTVFTVNVIQLDQESAEDLADRVEESLASYSETLSDSYRAHNLTLLSRATSQVVDSELGAYKTNCITEISTLQSKVNSLTGDMTDDQLNVLNYYIENQTMDYDEEIETTESTETTETTSTTVGISKTSVVLGAIVGALLACIILICFTIFKGTVNSASEFRSLYSLRVLGEVEDKRKKNILVRWWDKFMKGGKSVLALDQQKDLLFANLKNVCLEKNVKKVLLGGIAGNEADSAVIEEIMHNLSEQGIQAEFAPDFVHSVEMVDSLSTYDAVILVEMVHDSKCKMIEEEIRTCLEHAVQILGVIAFA